MIAVLAMVALAYEPPTLAPGDPAPPLEAEWLVGEALTPGATGRVTLVEFTASWCGPCDALRPEIVRISQDYADRVDVVSMHVFDTPEGAAAYVTANAGGLAPRVGHSGPEQVELTWMKAAGREGLPSIFLVDEHGAIAWIGYASFMIENLDALLAGDVDPAITRERYLRYARREAMETLAFPHTMIVGKRRARMKPPRQLLLGLDVAETYEPQVRLALADDRYDALVRVDRDAAEAFVAELAAHPEACDAMTLDEVAAAVAYDDKADVDPALLRTLSEEANRLGRWRDPKFLSTLARIQWREGDHEGAIETQRKALEVDPSSGYVPWMQETLDWYLGQVP